MHQSAASVMPACIRAHANTYTRTHSQSTHVHAHAHTCLQTVGAGEIILLDRQSAFTHKVHHGALCSSSYLVSLLCLTSFTPLLPLQNAMCGLLSCCCHTAATLLPHCRMPGTG
jgi:hypothetical protein